MRKALVLLLSLFIGLAVPAGASGHGGGEKSEESGDKEKKKGKKPAVHKITQSESYVMIEPIYTSIMDGSRPLGLLMVGIGLDVPNAELRERVETDMPQLRDAYVRNLMAFTAVGVRSWRQPDVAEMADRLQGVTDRVLHKKGARILLAQVAMRLSK
jgi:flagellar basal body-associated protein FliL